MDKKSKPYVGGEFRELFEASEMTNLAAEEMVAYSQSEEKYHENQLAIEYASRNSYDKGMSVGIEKGKLATARKLREAGMDPGFIKSITGIDIG